MTLPSPRPALTRYTPSMRPPDRETRVHPLFRIVKVGGSNADPWGMAARRLLRLRYPGSCGLCKCDLEPGTKAWWDSAAASATCVVCDVEKPADPFVGVDPELRGTAGGSAQAEHDRRVARFDGSRANGDSWQKGADGERRLSSVLHKEAGRGRLVVLDDRLIPGTRANIDHIAIAPSGVYVIDAKNYAGKVERRVEGFGRRRVERLFVKGRDRTKLVTGMERQIDAVRAAFDRFDVGPEAPIIPILCFVGIENWGLLDPRFTVADVEVLWPRALRKLFRRQGPLTGTARTKYARLLSTQLSPASH